MIGYKGFDENFCCQEFQFEAGKTYKHDGELKLCESGFHFCTNPLAVFNFYPPTNGNRYALVEVTGKTIFADDNTYKACTDEITIVKELSLDELIATVPKKDTATNTGDGSAATNTGVFSVATNTGNFSTAITSGYFSVASTVGNESESKVTGNNSAAVSIGRASRAIVSGSNAVALVTGKDSKAKGAIGCWLVLGEWDECNLIDVQLFKVDGEIIKPDTFYRLKDGKPVAVDD